eukprot:3990991-Prymnesium_polylepis.1
MDFTESDSMPIKLPRGDLLSSQDIQRASQPGRYVLAWRTGNLRAAWKIWLVPNFVFQAERGLSYSSSASDLMKKVSESLELDTHGTRVGATMAGGLNLLRNEIEGEGANHTGQNVLNMRFALGADDTTYLNSAISMLFTGTEMDNKQLDLSGLSPPDVQRHIRKA